MNGLCSSGSSGSGPRLAMNTYPPGPSSLLRRGWVSSPLHVPVAPSSVHGHDDRIRSHHTALCSAGSTVHPQCPEQRPQ